MLRSIDLKLRDRLKSRDFRQQWYRAQLEANVPDMFRSLREWRDMTQKELAHQSNMKQSAISRFEKSDEANWNFETLLKLADALDAQLVVSLVRSEDVIAQYERIETGGSTAKGGALNSSQTRSMAGSAFESIESATSKRSGSAWQEKPRASGGASIEWDWVIRKRHSHLMRQRPVEETS
jgi:transcriptional regulator with XRE-family HTH domain